MHVRNVCKRGCPLSLVNSKSENLFAGLFGDSGYFARQSCVGRQCWAVYDLVLLSVGFASYTAGNDPCHVFMAIRVPGKTATILVCSLLMSQ